MEIVFEIVAEIYVELINSLIPDKKLSKGATVFLRVFCALISFAILFTLLFGIMMLVDPEFTQGDDPTVSPWLLIGIGAGLILIQTGIAVFVYIKKKNNKK